MFKVLSSKKGVSPLIATILLIAFAVALGSVVMNWGFNFPIGGSTDRCRNVEITIRSFDNAEVCFGGVGQNGYINFIIDNTGAVDVNGLVIWIIGTKGKKYFDLDSTYIKRDSLYDKKDREITYDFAAYGDINEVQFIPVIKTERGVEICSKNSVKAKKIISCSQ